MVTTIKMGIMAMKKNGKRSGSYSVTMMIPPKMAEASKNDLAILLGILIV